MAKRTKTGIGLVTIVLLFFAGALAACGDPELSREAREAEGSSDPTAETGSPAPGLPPDIPSGGVPPF